MIRSMLFCLAVVLCGLVVGAGWATQRWLEHNIAQFREVVVLVGDCPYSLSLAESVVLGKDRRIGVAFTSETPMVWQEFLCPHVAPTIQEMFPLARLRSEQAICRAMMAATDRYNRTNFAWYPAFIVDGEPQGTPGTETDALHKKRLVLTRMESNLSLKNLNSPQVSKGRSEDGVESLRLRAVPIGY